MIEELLKEIETDSVREQVESLVITAESAPLAFHSARLQMAPVEEQLESVKALFDIGTEEAIYLATEGCGSVPPRFGCTPSIASSPSMRTPCGPVCSSSTGTRTRRCASACCASSSSRATAGSFGRPSQPPRTTTSRSAQRMSSGR